MAVELERVTRTVAGEAHLVEIDLRLEPGTMHVVLGHTGAGKTSLLRVIAGLDRPTAGTVRFDGADVTRRTAQQRSVALVYQQFINYPSLRVRDNIASPLRLRRAAGTDEPRDATRPLSIDARVGELARLLRIEDLLDRLPGELSGGQQQRVAIARALAKDADVVLLDEPLVNLDYKLREDLRDELRGLLLAARPGGKPATVIYATTDPGEALALSGTTVLLHHGRVLQHAPALEVYHRPASVVAAGVASDPPMNIVDGVVCGGAIELAGAIQIPLDPAGAGGRPGRGRHLARLGDGDYRFGIRASDCRLGAAPEGHVAVRARVELSEISGSETFIHLRASAAAGRFIVQHDGVLHHQLDDELTFFVDPDRLLAFGRDGHQPLVASYHPAGPAAETGAS
ncbi:MAG TPA: ABC transporter ATP-binding protein [Kofleriaceae bacterium]|nr:ABC transporter ATP-binding protein [Kofleriaceae bacterium]